MREKPERFKTASGSVKKDGGKPTENIHFTFRSYNVDSVDHVTALAKFV
jgi:hypothetical protein